MGIRSRAPADDLIASSFTGADPVLGTTKAVTEALGGAGDGPEVAYVCHAVQGEHQGIFAPFKGRHYFVEGLEFDGREECDDALVILPSDAVETLLGHGLGRDGHGPTSGQNLRQFLGLFPFEKQHAMQ